MSDFDPHNVDLDTVDAAQITCYLNSQGNDYDGRLGPRISAIFVLPRTRQTSPPPPHPPLRLRLRLRQRLRQILCCRCHYRNSLYSRPRPGLQRNRPGLLRRDDRLQGRLLLVPAYRAYLAHDGIPA